MYELNFRVLSVLGDVKVKKLMMKIKADAKKRNITGKMIAKWINVSEGMVTKYYKGESDMPAIKFIELVQFIYVDDLDKIKGAILSFIKVTERSDNLQELLEWSANTGDSQYILEVKKRVVHTPLLNESLVYQKIFERNKKNIKPDEFFLEIEDFKMEDHLSFDSKILLKIATLYSQLDMKSYSIMIPLALNILSNLEAVTSDYLQQSFRIRVLEMMAHAYLKLGEVHKVEEIADEVLSPEIKLRFPLPANAVLMLLAQAYVFTDKEKSFAYISDAVNMFGETKFTQYHLRRASLESTHDFIHIYHGDYSNLYLNDLSERSHLMAKKGNDSEALYLLDKIKREHGDLTAHQYYYRGLASGDKDDFRISLNKFAKEGDSFYSKLIKIQ